MKGFGAAPFPAAISAMVRPEATERSSARTASPSRIDGVFVAVLDQQPVGTLAAVAVVLHAHQDPAAVQALALEREFQIALRQSLLGRLGPSGSQ